jgi:asparagine synthase (glutamine-hydrolysing)
MCGIAWYLIDSEKAREKSKLLKHRGPDQTIVKNHFNQLWVFHRLAIINIDSIGMQPFHSNTSILICNGEIYNYKSLSNDSLKSDCEIVLKLLDKTKSNDDIINQIAKLDGDFAFVWSNQEKQVIARDHVGVCPLFYGLNKENKIIAVASEVKALIDLCHEIKVFPPGHICINNQFYKYKSDIKKIVNSSALLNTRNLLTEAIRKRIDHSDRPVGILCSGGIDSSIVACIIASLKKNLHVFTMCYKGSRSEDAFFAKLLCDKLRLKHTIFEFERSEVLETIPKVIEVCETYDPNTIRAAIPMYLLAHKIANNTDIKVILSGEGADELFHGYNYFNRAPTGNDEKKEAERLINNIHMFDLLRAERCFSSAGLEIRVPFLDQNLVSYIQTLDNKTIWNNQTQVEKKLLRDTFSYITELTESRILERTKERFSDGCGFNYVPQLLSDISGNLPFLKDRLFAEKKHIDKIFKELYGDNRHLIIERTMPSWIKQNETEDLLVN